jgi:hypothetical protein
VRNHYSSIRAQAILDEDYLSLCYYAISVNLAWVERSKKFRKDRIPKKERM